MNRGQKKIIAAVSGGIDSIVMLDMLVSQGFKPVVAHVNHGIRSDSAHDETLVRHLATRYKLPYETTNLNLGSAASEELARNARYKWLDECATKYDASVIMLAHHRDDVFETIAINLTRGTGWRGLSSLRSHPKRFRPLLSLHKSELIEYAHKRNLSWREDVTNDSPRYLRNVIRGKLQRMSPVDRTNLVELYNKQLKLKTEIDDVVYELLRHSVSAAGLRRHMIIMADESSATELLRAWLPYTLQRSRYRELYLLTKTARPGTLWHIDDKTFVRFDTTHLVVLSSRD